jgi:hypothetical protein
MAKDQGLATNEPLERRADRLESQGHRLESQGHRLESEVCREVVLLGLLFPEGQIVLDEDDAEKCERIFLADAEIE